MSLYAVLYAIEVICLIIQILCLFVIVLVGATICSMCVVSLLNKR